MTAERIIKVIFKYNISFLGVVKDAINYREKNDIKRKDFLELMLQLKSQGAIAGDEEEIKSKHYLVPRKILKNVFSIV